MAVAATLLDQLMLAKLRVQDPLRQLLLQLVEQTVFGEQLGRITTSQKLI